MVIDPDLALRKRTCYEPLASTHPDTQGVANVTLTHASGAISHCRGTWGPPGTAFRYTFRVAGTGGVREVGSAQHPGSAAAAAGPARADDGFLPRVPSTEDPYTLQLREFAGALTGGPAPRVTARDDLHAVELADAALEPIRSGRSVEIASGAEVAPTPGLIGLGPADVSVERGQSVGGRPRPHPLMERGVGAADRAHGGQLRDGLGDGHQ